MQETLTKGLILEVIYSFAIGGSERLAVAIAKRAKDLGCNVAVCAIRGTKGPIRDQLEKEGISCYGISDGNVSPIITRYRLYRLFRKLKPSVLHLHHVTQLIASYWPAKIARVPRLVLTEHASYSLRVVKKLNKKAKFYSKRADVVTTVHDGLKDFFINELGVPKNNIMTIPNGVDTGKYAPDRKNHRFRNELSIPDDALLFGCIGRLVEAKDHQNLLEAISIIKKNNVTGILFVVIGDGDLRESIEAKIRDYNIESYVIMAGQRSDIENILQGIDVCILSSKREGFPMVILEAMSCGVPCVSTAVGSVPNILDEKCGVVVPPENPQELAAGIISIAGRRNEYAKMGDYAREIVTANYDITNVLNKYLAVLTH